MEEEILINYGVLTLAKKQIYFTIKRTFDIICSIVGVIMLIPISIIIKIAYLSQKDFKSIFYRQSRLGKNGQIFKLYKYRTMYVDADEKLEEILNNNKDLRDEYKKNKKLKDDPRVTKIGRFLRKLSIDELPQFINVLLNQMSVVGNRPYLPREKKDMGRYYKEIIKVKPGITGLWQVSGRNDVSFKKRLKLEKEYSNIYSLKLDCKILLNTFSAVFNGK